MSSERMEFESAPLAMALSSTNVQKPLLLHLPSKTDLPRVQQLLWNSRKSDYLIIMTKETTQIYIVLHHLLSLPIFDLLQPDFSFWLPDQGADHITRIASIDRFARRIYNVVGVLLSQVASSDPKIRIVCWIGP